MLAAEAFANCRFHFHHLHNRFRRAQKEVLTTRLPIGSASRTEAQHLRTAESLRDIAIALVVDLWDIAERLAPKRLAPAAMRLKY